MPDEALSPDETEPENLETENQPVRRRGCLWRGGCAVLLFGWVVLLSIPTFMFILATQGEIAVWHGDRVPSSSEHPLLKITLLMEMETRGLNITTSNIGSDGDGEVCVQTHVNYLLWEGEGEFASYCDCYQRADVESQWALSRTFSGSCTG